jgi:hypothetical protein
MTIIVACDCGKRLRVPGSAGGKRVRCPGCGTVIAIPRAAPEPDAFSVEETSSREHDPAPRARKRKRRRQLFGRGIRRVLSIPFFVLAVVSAAITAWDIVVFHFFAGFGIGAGLIPYSESARLRFAGFVLSAVEVGITMGLFWVAECVLHGRLVGIHEAFNLDKE